MTVTATKTRSNTYAGTCSKCSTHVAAQAGVLGGKVNGRWTVRHTNCSKTATKTVKTYVAPFYIGRAYSGNGRCSECGNSGTCFSCRHNA